MRVRNGMLWAMAASLGMSAVPAAAQQMTTIDPNTAIDSDLDTPPPAQDSARPQDNGQPPLDSRTPPVTATEQAAPPADARALAKERVQAADTFDRQELV